jgi:hypothetical protein
MKLKCSEGQEKYFHELSSITPVGYFTGVIKNHSVLPCDEVFQRNRNDFPNVSFTLDVI